MLLLLLVIVVVICIFLCCFLMVWSVFEFRIVGPCWFLVVEVLFLFQVYFSGSIDGIKTERMHGCDHCHCVCLFWMFFFAKLWHSNLHISLPDLFRHLCCLFLATFTLNIEIHKKWVENERASERTTNRLHMNEWTQNTVTRLNLKIFFGSN